MSAQLICETARMVAGWQLDGGQRPGPWVSRHLGNCPQCREWVTAQTRACRVVESAVATTHASFATTPRLPPHPSRGTSLRPPAEPVFPWARLLTATGAFAAVVAALTVWQPWLSETPGTAQPLAQWRVAFQETLKKAQEPSALEKEFQATLRDAERAMTAVANGVASRDLMVSWSVGN